jgi:hypothetical protein
MVHGDCSSRGCYAMTDEQIAEIYSLGRESFFGGQKSFQFQAYPFRMTPVNMARHRNNPNMPFWKMIKEGYDHFEVTRQEPKVDFCEKKYVFDAVKAPNAKQDLVFNASAKCPAYAIPDEVADAVRERQEQEQAEVAKLVAKGTPVARLNTGIDGGMNKVFAARVPGGNTGLSEGGEGPGLPLLAMSRAPGTIPSTVNPPREPERPSDNILFGSPAEPKIAAATSAAPTRVANAAPSAPAQSEGFFSSLARKVGLSMADTTASAPTPAAKPKAGEAKASAPKIKPETKQAAAKPPLKPTLTDAQAAAPAPAPAPAAKDNAVAGSAPVVSSNSFDSRFSAVK